MEDGPVKKAYSPKEVESIYGLKRGVLAKWRCHGEGPKYVKTGRRKILYKVADVEAWLFDLTQEQQR